MRGRASSKLRQKRVSDRRRVPVITGSSSEMAIERICILGKAALLALSQLAGFDELARYSVRRDCGRVVTVAGRRVLVWPFLGWRNERAYASHVSIFREFCRVPVPPRTRDSWRFH